MTLFERYEAAIACGDINDDNAQRQILGSMQRLAAELKAPAKRSWFNWGRKEQPLGLYLYGPVGVGKTYLMDLFFETVEEPRKVRFHFHHFMQQIDAQLRRLQGQKNPLQRIASDLAKQTRLLCFDEFLVDDVAYAMILAQLLDAFFAEGIILVATSNTRPDNLYLKGVHRERFLPAIALIKKNCEVLCLNEKKDYRLGRELLLEAYLFPLGEATATRFAEQFRALAPQAQESGSITVQHREIPYVKWADDVLWFDFNVLCNLPRSQLDYLELADRFDTIFVANIPVLSSKDTVSAILLVHLIDVMYDRGIRLIISAAAPAEQLYVEGEMQQVFKRTLSRLKEMQTADYLRRHPKRKVIKLQDSAT